VSAGGLGPTLDDVTMAALAEALDQQLALHPQLEARIRGHFGARTTRAHLKMAEAPTGGRVAAARHVMLGGLGRGGVEGWRRRGMLGGMGGGGGCLGGWAGAGWSGGGGRGCLGVWAGAGWRHTAGSAKLVRLFRPGQGSACDRPLASLHPSPSRAPPCPSPPIIPTRLRGAPD
jgi:hypothetical protein